MYVLGFVHLIADIRGQNWLYFSIACRLIFFKDLFIYVYEYCICLYACMTEESIRQKRASDPSMDGCEPPCDCCELNSGTLEEQPVLITAWAISPTHFFHIARQFCYYSFTVYFEANSKRPYALYFLIEIPLDGES